MKSSVILPIFFTLAFTLSCASKHHLTSEYQEALPQDLQQTSGKTILVILIDGLPLSTLKTELARQHLPQIQRYFRIHNNQVLTARTAFPSLTFPSIGSLLMERPVEDTKIYGNTILHGGEAVNFESPLNYAKLNTLIEGQNIFSRLKAQGLKTISVEYGFDANADAHMERGDTQAASFINNRDYTSVDSKLTGALNHLLRETNPKLWPDFIFLHLVGLDFTSHDRGPKSKAALDYLQFLDRKLGTVFYFLEKSELAKQRKIITLLTADHGFDRTIERVSNLEGALKRVDPRIIVLNEGRFLGLFFPRDWPPKKREALMDELAKNSSVDLVGTRRGDEILIRSLSQAKELNSRLMTKSGSCPNGTFVISISGSEFKCPEELGSPLNQLFYPYFLNNISHYFRTPNSPDAIVIARPGTAFRRGPLGAHGGPTPQEIYVPLLLRNTKLPDPLAIPELSELLRFLEKKR